MNGFHERKAERTDWYKKYIHGWRLQTCGACNGSGRYDHNGSPRCGCCNGTGKERVRGPKAIIDAEGND
jgi:DnaJ-class molecular chaperone